MTVPVESGNSGASGRSDRVPLRSRFLLRMQQSRDIDKRKHATFSLLCKVPSSGRDLLAIRLARGDEPASTHAGHRLERQPVGRGPLSDASGRTKAALREGSGERLERGDTASGHGRKEFEPA
jgi:hypothetical protein